MPSFRKATQSQAVDIAVLMRDVGDIEGSVNSIESRMDLFDKEYIKRAIDYIEITALRIKGLDLRKALY